MHSMKARLINAFINKEGELRCGWRVAAFVVCFFVLMLLLINGVLPLAGLFLPSLRNIIQPPAPLEPPERALLRLGVDSAVNLCSAILATYICANKLEHRTFGSVGFKRHQGWRRLIVVGSFLGAG